MNKVINIILIALFAFINTKYDYGYTLLLPIICIYVLHNSKSLLLFIPISLVSIMLWGNGLNGIVPFGVMYILIIIYIIFLSKRNNFILDFIYMLLGNAIIFLINKNSDYIMIVIYCIMNSILFTVIRYLIKDNKKNFIYFEILSIIITILGAVNISEYNVGLILACYYIMYFAYNTNAFFTIIFAFSISTYLYYINNIKYAIVLPLIGIIYLLNSIASGFIVIIASFGVCLIYPEYFNIALSIDIVCIVFEFVKGTVINSKIKKKEVLKDGYKNSMEILNKDVIAFSTFLDLCSADTDLTREYYKKLDEGVNSLIDNYCEKCYLKNKCNKQNEYLKEEFKDLLINCKSIDYDLKKSPALSVCPYNIELRKSAIIINEKMNFVRNKSKSQVIVSTLNGISNILRQYTVDNNIKKEINHEYIYKMKKAISDSGYSITYFNIQKMFEEDFLFEIGIRGYCFEDIREDLNEICNKNFYVPVSVHYNYTDKGKVYMKIIPHVKCQVQCCSSNIASGMVSGDNVLVTDTHNGRSIAVICDGMGKGYNANLASDSIIKILESLFQTSLSSYAIIQILNTYCGIKDSLDNFCTLDYLELNKQTNLVTFYKMSAAPSYIFHKNNEVEKIENKRLPLGKESEIIVNTANVSDGDLVVMTSDGIFENVISDKDIESFILSISHMPVEKIVYQILDYVKTGTRLCDDDISLIVMKVLPC